VSEPELIGEGVLLCETSGLFEAPCWDGASAGAFYSVADDGGVWRYDTVRSVVEPEIPHRKGVGGMALHSAGGFVVSGRDVIWRRGDDRRVVIANDPTWGLNRFNDLCTDPAGRVYAGALDYDPAEPQRQPNPGKLLVADLDGSVRIVDEGMLVANGLGVSPGGETLYLADTAARAIYAYTVDGRGDLGPRRRLVELAEAEPDGLAVAADGSIWVALREPGSISVFAPDGRPLARLVPHAHPTSLCFGGSDLRDIYMTTSDSSSGRSQGQFWRLRANVAGLPRSPARVPVGGGQE
jgi:D-xylonolactonase